MTVLAQLTAEQQLELARIASETPAYRYLGLTVLIVAVVLIALIWFGRSIILNLLDQVELSRVALEKSTKTDDEQNAVMQKMTASIEGSTGALQGTGLQLTAISTQLNAVQRLVEALTRDGAQWHMATRHYFDTALQAHHADVIRSLSEQAAISGGIHVPFPPPQGLHFDWHTYLVKPRNETRPIHLYKQPVWDDRNLLMTFSEPQLMQVIEGYMQAFYAVVVTTSDAVPMEGWLNKESVVLEVVEESNQMEGEVLVVEDNN